MTMPAIELDLKSNVQISDRDMRVFQFLKDRKPEPRDKIMEWCEFPSPREQPVLAYVQFANSMIRLNHALHHLGMGVEGGVDTGEIYRLVGGRP